jgi:hypothetical protein
MARTGGDYDRFIKERGIEFPIIPGESQGKPRSPGEESRARPAAQELDRNLRTLEALFNSFE